MPRSFARRLRAGAELLTRPRARPARPTAPAASGDELLTAAVKDGPLHIMTPPDGRILIDLSDFSDMADISRADAMAAAGQLVAAVRRSLSNT
ncbi:hypothetical protein [Nonomuraea sp. NPDC003214]